MLRQIGPPLVLGADLSTDGLEYVVVNAESGKLVATGSCNFVERFGKTYGLSVGGYLELADGVVRVPFGLVSDALDWMFEDVFGKLKDAGVSDIRLVCVSSAQHSFGGWRFGAQAILERMGKDAESPLSWKGMSELFVPNEGGFTSWRDTASLEDAELLEQGMSPNIWAEHFGSSPLQSLRFLGPQAYRFARVHPKEYEAAWQFNVLASIIGSLLTGRMTGMGLDEASCTLLMALREGKWSRNFQMMSLPGLLEKLPEIVAPGANLGPLWKYRVARHGFPVNCTVSLGMGDNPAAALTMNLGKDGMGLSLGSSGTTYRPPTKMFWDRAHHAHVLRSASGGYLGMFCTSTCGKFADRIRRDAGLEWGMFDAIVGNVNVPPNALIFPGPDGNHDYRSILDKGFVPAAVTRAILLNMKLHSSFLGAPGRIVATGGFASEPVCQVIADIFECPVFAAPAMNRVAWGSAVMAASQVLGIPTSDAAARLCPTGKEFKPDPTRQQFYRQCMAAFQKAFPSS